MQHKCNKVLKCIYQNEFKQGALVHFEELLVPHRNVICPLLLVLIVLRRWGVIFVMSAPLNHLEENTHTHARTHTLLPGEALKWSEITTAGTQAWPSKCVFSFSFAFFPTSLPFSPIDMKSSFTSKNHLKWKMRNINWIVPQEPQTTLSKMIKVRSQPI